MKNSDLLYLLAKVNRKCGYEQPAISLEAWAAKEWCKEQDQELTIMEAEDIANGK